MPIDPGTAISVAVAAYKGGKYGYKLGNWLTNNWFGGKDKFGSFYIWDSSYEEWKVRVRRSEKRGCYLKLTSDGVEVLATVSPYKPHKYGSHGKYPRISMEEWEACVLLADGESGNRGPFIDQELVEAVREVIMDRLT